MPRYPYPNVPKAPGVPQVTRSPLFPNTTPPALGTALALGRLALALTRSSGWGIYLDTSDEDIAQARRINAAAAAGEVGELSGFNENQPPVLVPDSFRDFAIRQDWSVTTAPTEQGGFASYNKVNNPFELMVRMTKGGSLRERTDFLEKLDGIVRSLRLYKIVTPERTYFRCNVVRYEVTRKEASGAYFLAEVDVFFTEIRSVTSEYTNTTFNTTAAKQAADEPVKNFGVKQAVAE